MNIVTTAPEFPRQHEQPTMSSREIAELVEARHDSVKRTIERLVERGVIDVPPMVEDQIQTAHGRKHTTSVYRLEKRDSFVVVAQLSPEFTARLVDRWQELEAQVQAAPAPAIDVNNKAQLQLIAMQLIEVNQRQEEQIEAMREDVEALDKIANADGSLTPTEVAKNLGMRPKDLFQWLSQNGWIYKRPGASSWLGYQSKCNQGLLEHKTTAIYRSDGSEKITEQVRITPKGLVALAKVIRPTARLI